MAFLAYDLDALKTAPHVARAAGIAEDTAIAGLLRMWAWCWQEKTDRVDDTQVRGFFGADASQALESFGFLQRVLPERDFRVRGAGRYLRVSEGRRKGGLAARKNLVPGAFHRAHSAQGPAEGGAERAADGEADGQPMVVIGSPSALTPNTEHRTPNTEEKDKRTSASADAAVVRLRGPSPADLQALWNEKAPSVLPRWKELGNERKRKATLRLRERPLDGPSGWGAVIEAIANSPFCLGQNGTGWVATPDWILQSDTAAKVLEGKYSSRAGTGHAKGRASEADRDWSRPIQVDSDGQVVL